MIIPCQGTNQASSNTVSISCVFNSAWPLIGFSQRTGVAYKNCPREKNHGEDKIENKNANDQSRKHKLLEILSKNYINALKTISLLDGFVVLKKIEQELDKIFNWKTHQKLEKKKGIHPLDTARTQGQNVSIGVED